MASTLYFSPDITFSLSSSPVAKASFSSDCAMTDPCFDLGKSEEFLQIFISFSQSC